MDDAEQAEPEPTEHGARWWVVLGVTAIVGVTLVGGGLAIDRWVLTDDEQPEAAPTTTVDETIDVEPVAAASANRLFTRETEAGIEIRVHQSDDEMFVGGFGPPGFDDSDRPAWCRIEAMVTVSALSTDAIGQAQLPRTEEPPPDGAVTLGQGGMIEGAPMILVVADVPAGVTRALLSHPGGGADWMEPIDGIAALAIELPAADPGDEERGNPEFGPFGPFGPDMKLIGVEFLHKDGTTSRLSMDDLFRGPPVWASQECNDFSGEGDFGVATTAVFEPPELELPDAGPEQPLDPAAERAAIEAVVTRLYTGIDDDATLFETVDDASGLDLLMDEVLERPDGDEFLEMEPEITDLVFFSPIEASFIYTSGLSLHNDPVMGKLPQFGRARLVDGVWKVTRSTICQDIQKIGTPCTI